MRDNLVLSFAGLGFDPAPGSPATLRARAREAESAARSLAGAAAAAARLTDGVGGAPSAGGGEAPPAGGGPADGWRGEAAEAFQEGTRDLPRDLRHAAEAHRALSRALSAYADDLAGRQLRAADLEDRALALRRALSDAGPPGVPFPLPAGPGGVSSPHQANPSGMPSPLRTGPLGVPSPPTDGPGGVPSPLPGGPGGVPSLLQAGPAGVLSPLQAELAAVLAAAARLQAEHRASAALAAARVRAATDPPYREPGRLDRLRTAAERWVARHADVLGSIARDLRGVSTVLGTVSLVPGFQFLAPVAIAAGAAAVVLDAAVLVATGRGSWPVLLADAALTALPTGPVARAVRRVPGAARALKAANRAVPAGVRGPLFRAVRNLPEGITADQLAGAAARIRSAARGLADDVVVQGSRAGHSARARSDVDFGLRVDPDRYEALIRECFGDAPGEARTNAVERGRIFWRRAGLRDLHDALQADLGRKVDLSIIKRGGRFDNEPWLPVR